MMLDGGHPIYAKPGIEMRVRTKGNWTWREESRGLLAWTRDPDWI